MEFALLPVLPPALLALADGTVFKASRSALPANRRRGGVQHRADRLPGNPHRPELCQQIVTLTYPHIGNYGVSAEDVEAKKVIAAGLIIKDLPLLESNFRSDDAAGSTCSAKAPWRSPTSTRAPDARAAHHGAQNGCILTLAARRALTDAHRRRRSRRRKAAPSMAGLDLAKVVSEREPYEWTETEWRSAAATARRRADVPRRRLRLRRQAQHPAHAGRAAAAASPWCRRRRRPPRC
jgi:carbamoyl-phosphate synthase small subunit